MVPATPVISMGPTAPLASTVPAAPLVSMVPATPVISTGPAAPVISTGPAALVISNLDLIGTNTEVTVHWGPTSSRSQGNPSTKQQMDEDSDGDTQELMFCKWQILLGLLTSAQDLTLMRSLHL